MKLLLKRDESGTSFPSPDQLDIGELVINSVTGKLYSKLKDGSVVEWIGQRICFDPVPEISVFYENSVASNDSINSFCCLGGIIEVEVAKLKPLPEEYTFEFVELTANAALENISIQNAQFTDYTIPKPDSTNNETVPVRKAIVPINLAILNNKQPISIFKFSVVSVTQNNKKLIEKIITIKCQETS